MTKYDEDCLACNYEEGSTYYDDHVHADDSYPAGIGKPPAMQGYVTNDSGERQHFASGMQRDTTTGKTRWHLISYGPMLRRWAELMTRGAIKYDDNNWMKANSDEEYDRFKASAFRHFMQWYSGDTDEDHAAATIFNMNGAEYVNDKLDDEPIGTKKECVDGTCYHPPAVQWGDDHPLHAGPCIAKGCPNAEG